MDPKRFQMVREAFDLLAELDAVEARQKLESLALDSTQKQLLTDMLNSDARVLELRLDHPDQLVLPVLASSYVGKQIGPWQIERVLGMGGMGRVFLARRHDGLFDGQVAIKFLNEQSAGNLFAKERAALARLNAPGIARLIDAGNDDQGRAYLVMEYVAGALIDAWCDQQHASVRARIGLMIETLHAIAHAHSQLVLHRDLKPSNLIVDASGRVKVLDFGIAKLLDGEDSDFQATAARYFTLRYAAPEQISGEPIGIGTDLFALAIVLYELLTDAHPFLTDESERHQLAERVLTGQPIPLSRRTAAASLTEALGSSGLRDLDAVLQRALDRQTERRFRSAMDFAEELDRILLDQPVLSRRPGWWALGLRQIRRHPWISLGTLLALSGLFISAVIAFQQRAEARRERDLARHQAARAERMAGFLSSLFESAQPRHSAGQTPTVADLLERGQQKLHEETNDDPLLQARLTVSLADTWRALGQLERAEALLEELIAQNPALNEDHKLAAEAYAALAKVRSFRADWSAALTALDAADRALEQVPGEPVLRANILKQRAMALMNTDRLDAAKPVIAKARDLLLPLADSEPEALIGAEALLATAAYLSGELTQSRDAFLRIVAMERQMGPGRQAGLVTNLNNLAAIEARIGLLDDAVTHYREAVNVGDRTFGADHREAALPRLGLGMALRQLGEATPAIEQLQQSAAIYQTWSGPEHPESRYADLLLAETLWLNGDHRVAKVALQRVLADNPMTPFQNGERDCRARWLAYALQLPDIAPRRPDAAMQSCRQALAADTSLRVLLDWLDGGPSADRQALRDRANTLKAPDRMLSNALQRESGGR
ncbi:hypothetical protein C7S18_07000 [Ahniella affigens]|uniref:Protein kinase domain-containing protein n=1 Tax=Ahniella affigens TaxID=2021234 RepID=A0A2P1PQ45_9GAMM|nr:serine/threonine-protein kinase [Ahniella affigens]AVP96959.1 hypothetical protein C7S18_07000 [Ahniella affigens]